MSWVKLDDGAFEHPKLLDAGPRAAWLWVCCLSYCNGQKRRDGFVPRARIATLYPGVGMKEADRLVSVRLLEECDGGFLMHGYHEYQPSASLSDVRSMVGKQGGIKSGEARRSKREAIASTKETILLEAPNEPPSRPDPDPSPPDQIRSARASSGIREQAEGYVKDPFRSVAEHGPPETWPDVIAANEAFLSVYPAAGKLRGRDPRAVRIVERYADGFTLEQLVAAAKGSRLDEHIASSASFQTVATVWRDAAQVDKFAALLAAPPKPKSDPGLTDDDAGLMLRARRGEYGKRIQDIADTGGKGTTAADIRAMVRERAAKLVGPGGALEGAPMAESNQDTGGLAALTARIGRAMP